MKRLEIYTNCFGTDMIESETGEYVLYDDVKELIRLVGNLVGKNGWEVTSFYDNSTAEEAKETLYALEKEIMKIES